ncbi:exostosin family protein [Agromyces sp. Marseille-P2726]|uniref:exostosin domain-containing protein n=1 Tax=Agromyces sp. Marseille-P2726 TaxID=2709132 RepID=UPI001570A41F|nr:exostosin family protein [Agromyces sp. Marseille-P2726]
MRIHLPSIGVRTEISAVRDFERLAQLSGSARHDLVADPAEADVILFTELHQLNDPISLSRVWQSPEFKTHAHKCYVFDQRPRSYCSMPGLYTSVPWRSLRRQYQVPWSYHMITDVPHAPDREPDLLFSFVGTARSHKCREQLFGLSHPRGLVRRVDGHVNWRPNDPGFAERRDSFADSVTRASFVLCPRGRATSSFRFYETIAAGRVPVVLADDWVPPAGVNLQEFAIVWPERNVSGLVDFLEGLEPDASAMGRRAREVFEERFAPEVMFDNIVDALNTLAATLPWETFPRFGYPPDRRVVRHLVGRSRKLLGQLTP